MSYLKNIAHREKFLTNVYKALTLRHTSMDKGNVHITSIIDINVKSNPHIPVPPPPKQKKILVIC